MQFKFPVSYTSKKMTLQKHIIDDMELVSLNGQNDFTDSIYDKLFKPKHILSKNVLIELVKEYSYDKKFLKDTQKIIKEYNPPKFDESFDKVYQEWDDIKKTKNFKDFYNYYIWKIFEPLNNNDTALEFLTIYTLSSPVFSLLLPIFMLIVPFLIIKIRGLQLSLSEYYSIIMALLKNHSLGRALTSFNGADINKKAYLIFSVFFYFFSIYQNIITCVRFTKNIRKIYNTLFMFKEYLEIASSKMECFMAVIIKRKTYNAFYNDIKSNKEVLDTFLTELKKLQPLKINIKCLKQLGFTMNQFYQLYSNTKYETAIQYSFDCVGYMDIIENFPKLAKCNFSKKTNINKMTYPVTKDAVKNNIVLDKPIILTGPNASGKTTILKSTLINILLSQQFGFGCFQSADIKLYKFIHSYLNIPDTSGRDSLFQAEARRCKEIIDCIQKNKSDNHFCIFDELYSGTNPEEAIISANAFMNYISTNVNVDCILTTHYIELCKLLKTCINYKMDTKQTNNNFEYTYTIVPGISDVKGGIKILNDMNYPKEILEKMK